MNNMLDYITWRGDLPLDTVPVGEVDGLILAQLSMMHWEYALAEDATGTPEALFPSMDREPVSVGFTVENDVRLLEKVARSARFGQLTLSDYVQRFDEAQSLQFAAIVIHLPDGTIFVSFRGTDNTLVGWREDCNLAFSRPVPAQEAALEYLKVVSAKYPGGIRVGGHSKGGNLAMYAASTVGDSVRQRILAVYNYDGPGLSDRMDSAGLYSRLRGRLYSYVPQGSIVGLLLAHPDHYAVVRSDAVGFLQHDPYTWQVEGPAFLRMPELNRDSARFDIAFRRWLGQVDDADRKTLISTLFKVLQATRANTFGSEFWQGLAHNPLDVMSAIWDVPTEDRKRVSRMLADLAADMLHPQKDSEDADNT